MCSSVGVVHSSSSSVASGGGRYSMGGAGARLANDNSRPTVLDGCAPTASQYCNNAQTVQWKTRGGGGHTPMQTQRDRQRDRGRQRDRETATDRETERQRQTERQTNKETDRETHLDSVNLEADLLGAVSLGRKRVVRAQLQMTRQGGEGGVKTAANDSVIDKCHTQTQRQ